MERKSEPTSIEKKSRERILAIIAEFCEGSQQQLAEKTKIGKASISQYVNGKNVPSNITAAKLGRPFGINPAWIMGFDEPKYESDKQSAPQEEGGYDALARQFFNAIPDSRKAEAVNYLRFLASTDTDKE